MRIKNIGNIARLTQKCEELKDLWQDTIELDNDSELNTDKDLYSRIQDFENELMECE